MPRRRSLGGRHAAVGGEDGAGEVLRVKRTGRGGETGVAEDFGGGSGWRVGVSGGGEARVRVESDVVEGELEERDVAGGGDDDISLLDDVRGEALDAIRHLNLVAVRQARTRALDDPTLGGVVAGCLARIDPTELALGPVDAREDRRARILVRHAELRRYPQAHAHAVPVRRPKLVARVAHRRAGRSAGGTAAASRQVGTAALSPPPIPIR